MDIADNVVVALKKTIPIQKGKSPTLFQLVLLNAIVCGLELCASAGFTYIPPMLLKAGIPEKYMSIVIGMGPFLGLFLVPLIGRLSDQCGSRWGRRRPFIFWLGIGLIVSLVLIPYGEMFALIFLLGNPFAKNIGILLLTIGVVLLDFTSQAGLTPCEALLSDTSKGTDVSDRAFMVYSFMISIGGCIGYLITALDWTNSPIGPYFGGQEQSVFSVLMFLFVITMGATLFVADDPPLHTLDQTADDSDSEETSLNGNSTALNATITSVNGAVNLSQDLGYDSLDDLERVSDRFILNRPNHGAVPGKAIQLTVNKVTQRRLRLPGRVCASFRSLLQRLGMKLHVRLPKIIQDLLEVPDVLLRLALTDFFSWAALMCFNLFYTDFIGQAVYQGNPNAEDGSEAAKLYDTGVRLGSWGLLFHCVTSAAFASVMDKFLHRFGTRRIYFISMATFTISMVAMVFCRDIVVVNLLASVTGIAFAAITTIPFTLVTMYQENKELFFYDIDRTKARGTGQDISVLDSSYFLAQVVLSAFMGYIVHATGTVTSYMITASLLGLVSCICINRVVYTKQDLINLHRRKQRNIFNAT